MATCTSRLFLLDLGLGSYPAAEGRILTCRPDGSEVRELVGNLMLPDGIAVDVANQHIYWTNMGTIGVNDGSVQRCNFAGADIVTLVPPESGGTHTPKQTIIAPRSKKLYWCDREGMKVMRANLDGSEAEVLHYAGEGDEDRLDGRNWCVGIAVDEEAGKVYWTQKGPSKGGQGRILRMNVDIRSGESAHSRSDIETLLDNLPEPIDLEFDHDSETLYWTDRGDPPNGNSVNSVSIADLSANGTGQQKMIVRKLHEAIGLAMDSTNKKLFFGDLGGSVYRSNYDGTKKETIIADIGGEVTGIAFVEA